MLLFKSKPLSVLCLLKFRFPKKVQRPSKTHRLQSAWRWPSPGPVWCSWRRCRCPRLHPSRLWWSDCRCPPGTWRQRIRGGWCISLLWHRSCFYVPWLTSGLHLSSSGSSPLSLSQVMVGMRDGSCLTLHSNEALMPLWTTLYSGCLRMRVGSGRRNDKESSYYSL